MNRSSIFLCVLLLNLIPCVKAHARGVSWADSFGDNLVSSDGVTPLDGTFQFELGGFGSGFTPTLANMSLWQSNWVVFDSATTANGGWNPAASYFTSTATALAGVGSNVVSSATGSTFAIGQAAYLWTFNSKSIAPGSEWALVRNNSWTYPANDPTGLVFNLEWAISDAGTTAVAGSTNYDGGTFVTTLQTQAVPEPGSALLIAVAGVLIRLRRRVGR